MKVYTVALGVLVACAAAMALERSPLMMALQPVEEPTQMVPVYVQPQEVQGPRQKRSLLLGGAAGLAGLGLLGAGAIGVGLIGAKAGLVGGALAATALHGHGRGFGGGYGYGGGYGGGYHYGGGYGGYGGYHGGYGGYRSYPTYYVEESWC